MTERWVFQPDFFFFLVLFRECKRRRNIFVFVCLLFFCTRMFTFCTTKNWLSIHLNLHQMYFVWYVVIYHLYQWNQIKPKIKKKKIIYILLFVAVKINFEWLKPDLEWWTKIVVIKCIHVRCESSSCGRFSFSHVYWTVWKNVFSYKFCVILSALSFYSFNFNNLNSENIP